MIVHPFGPAGRSVPTIGQGTWMIPESGAAAEEAKRSLRRGIELGMVHIDTFKVFASTLRPAGSTYEVLARSSLGGKKTEGRA